MKAAMQGHLATDAHQRPSHIVWLVASISSVSFSAFGADTPIRDPRVLEEVTVTAQRREEQLEDVPIAITVLGGVDLDGFTGEDVTNALVAVPGVKITEGILNGTTQLSLRGVAAAAETNTGSSPVAYYIDSVPFGFVRSAIAPDPPAYDLDRVEVLRGPQGTLYGASALNGVVRVLTRDPNLKEFELKARTSLASTDKGSESYRGDLVVNAPIIDDKLGARLAIGYADLGGWIDSLNATDINDSQSQNIRLKIGAQPTERLSLGLMMWRSRTDVGSQSVSDDHDVYPGTQKSEGSVDYDTYGLDLGYQSASFSLTSVSSYIDFKNPGRLDWSPFTFLGISGFLESEFDAKVFAQEITLNSTQEGPWRWTLGGFYRDAEDQFYQRADSIEYRIRNWNTSESFAAFGELTRVLADGKFEVTAGLRYFEDEVSSMEDVDLDDPAPKVDVAQTTFQHTSPRAVFAWHPDDQSTVYASYARGFRSGYNQTLFALSLMPTLEAVNEDELNNYEVGWKSNVLDGRLAFDASVYYMDWQDVQMELCVRFSVGCETVGVNGSSASGLGVDLVVSARPADRLTLGFNASWNDLATDQQILAGDVVLFEAGERLSHSAEYNLGASLSFGFPIGAGGLEWEFSASANYSSGVTVKSFLAPVVTTTKGDYILDSRASFALLSPDRWTLELYAENIANERGTPMDDQIEFYARRLRPRTIGLQLEYRL